MTDLTWPLIAHIADGHTITEAEAAAIIDALRVPATPANATDTAGLEPSDADVWQMRAEAAEEVAAALRAEMNGWRVGAEMLEQERDALRAENERLRDERYRLAYAICGGEDFPGILDATSVEELERLAKAEDRAHGQAIDRVLKLQAERDRLQAELARAREAERERIAAALDEEASTTPCSEDAVVVADCARLVRADFSYEEAEKLAQSEAAALTQTDRTGETG